MQTKAAIAALIVFIAAGLTMQLSPAKEDHPSATAAEERNASAETPAPAPAPEPREFHALTADGLRR